MVKFEADGKVLKRHEHEGEVEHRDSKRVRFTHNQPDKRAELEVTDDTAAKRAKLSDSQSSSSSSDIPQSEIAPNLHDLSGETGDLVSRENVTKKARVGANMEVGAIEALKNAKQELDRALHCANKTLHRVEEGIPLESEAVNKAAEIRSFQTQEGPHRGVRGRSRRQGYLRQVGA